jgi:AraC-like DNA-binding protein
MRNILAAGVNYERTFLSFEACNEALRRICGPYQVAADHWPQFRGSIETRRAGSLEFANVAFSDGRITRDRDDRYYRGDHFFLILQAAGTARMRQRGSEATLKPGDCTLIDSRFPSIFEIGPGFHQYSFHLPAHLMTERFGDRALPLARTIRGNCGAGALLSEVLGAVVANAATIGDVDLTGMTLELLATALGLNAERTAPLPATRRPMSLSDIAHFIDTHMDDPDLSPASIAAHFNTSVRRLYRLVRESGWTPASLIWSRRLARARDLLMLNAHRAPIIEVAFTCGFKDGAHFSRAYRKAFGHPPKAERHLAIAASATAGDSA